MEVLMLMNDPLGFPGMYVSTEWKNYACKTAW